MKLCHHCSLLSNVCRLLVTAEMSFCAGVVTFLLGFGVFESRKSKMVAYERSPEVREICESSDSLMFVEVSLMTGDPTLLT